MAHEFQLFKTHVKKAQRLVYFDKMYISKSNWSSCLKKQDCVSLSTKLNNLKPINSISFHNEIE